MIHFCVFKISKMTHCNTQEAQKKDEGLLKFPEKLQHVQGAVRYIFLSPGPLHHHQCPFISGNARDSITAIKITVMITCYKTHMFTCVFKIEFIVKR